MAITTVTLSTRFVEWKDITNELITVLGDNDALTTTATTSLVAAINELDAYIGDLGSLNTDVSSDLVGAINDVLSKLGTVANLNTTATNAVAAINELLVSIGDLTTLTTTVKTSTVNAINELVTKLGDLTTLTTTAQGSLVAAVNELNGDVGDTSTLTTTATGSVVAAVNELDGDVGDLSSLTTTAQGSLVAAVNEVDAEAQKIDDVQFENQELNGGRFATDNLSTIAVSTFDDTGLMIEHNSAVFTQDEQFINDNANYGGSGGTMGSEISSLVSAFGSKGGRTGLRYGYEFYILRVTAGANTSNGIVHSTINYYPFVANNQRMLGSIGRQATFMCWMRLKTLATPANNGIVIGDNTGNLSNWIDAAPQSSPYLLTTAANWVHVKQTIDLSAEFSQFFPGFYGNSGDVIQIALPVLVPADVNFMHVGLVN